MIYRAQDKNNGRLDRRCMRRFRSFLNRAQLEEINMIGRLYTWSSERERPTLELLDRMFATADWFAAFPNHVLKPLSSDCSDHCPLLLQLQAFTGAKRRFRFESFWVKLPGFAEVVACAWAPTLAHADSSEMSPRRCEVGATQRLAASACNLHSPARSSSDSMTSRRGGSWLPGKPTCVVPLRFGC